MKLLICNSTVLVDIEFAEDGNNKVLKSSGLLCTRSDSQENVIDI